MSLTSGQLLGPYQIQSALGAGGMGEVYKARDTRLDRTVAIKVLPAHLASDRDFRDRFDREARVISQLDHPHICALYDVGEQDGTAYLVMQYLEGETLAERISKSALGSGLSAPGPKGDAAQGERSGQGPTPLAQSGPTGLPVAEALAIASQIAEALDAAHRAGIVHRDLKPGNIMLTRSGSGRGGAPHARLLDFGLAKAGAVATAGPVHASMLPTTPAALTVQGTILGTFQYMAPEQLEGQEADARSDIFSFGAVLYEMLAGRKAFEGKSQASLIAAILEHEPPALSTSGISVSRQLEHVVARCLAKSPDDRWQTASDLRRELKWAEQVGADQPVAPSAALEASSPSGRSAGIRTAAAAALAGALIAGLGAWAVMRPSLPVAAPVARLSIPLPDDQRLFDLNNPGLAVSPQGTLIAYAATSGGRTLLHLRAIDGTESKAVPGTELASNPFFSPDGQWIGFFAQGEMKKVSVATGTTQTVCDAGVNPRGGAWGPDGSIYFGAGLGGILKVSAEGGTPVPATSLDRGRGEISHRWPQVLPGGRALLFTAWTGPGRGEMQIHLQRLDGAERQVLVQGGESGRYVGSGHIVYARDDELYAVPFDLGTFTVSGQASRLGDAVWTGGEGAQFDVSADGVLVSVAGNPQRFERRLVWVNRDGRVEPLAAPPREYSGNVVVSPDGRRAAVDISDDVIGIWLYDFARTTLTPLTTGDGSSQAPRWTPDGTRIVYRGTRSGSRNLWWKTVDDTVGEERLTTHDLTQTPGSWSADGRWLAYNQQDPETGSDIWVLPFDGDRRPRSVVAAPSTEWHSRVSPDGRWLAYASTQPGREEVFVQPFPGPGARVQISSAGGSEPVWSRDSRELFYLEGDAMMAVSIGTAPTLDVGTPRRLFEGRFVPSPNGVAGYDVSPDGQRFLRVQPLHPDPPTDRIQVVLNWFEELRRAVP